MCARLAFAFAIDCSSDLHALLLESRGFLDQLSKARGGQLFKSLLDLYLDMPSTHDEKVCVCVRVCACVCVCVRVRACVYVCVSMYDRGNAPS